MTIEEKARAYDEALEKVKPLYERAKKDDSPIWSTYEHLFPQLTDSEDERIRKELLEVIRHCYEDGGYTLCTDDYKKYSAYLEKQKEQKSAEWSEDYREEDLRTRFAFYTYKDEDSVLYLSNVFVEETSRNKGFGTKILAAAEKVAETLGAIQIRLKVKQDSPANAWYRKHGYGYMAFEDGYDWLEKTLEYMKPIKSEWSDDDETRLKVIKEELERFIMFNQYGTSLSVDDINWLKSLPERFNLPHKQEWNSDDNVLLNNIINVIQSKKHVNDGVARKTYVDFLKSLRPHWKPSEEQMKALHAVSGLASLGEYIQKHLFSLYNDLQKLL